MKLSAKTFSIDIYTDMNIYIFKYTKLYIRLFIYLYNLFEQIPVFMNVQLGDVNSETKFRK